MSSHIIGISKSHPAVPPQIHHIMSVVAPALFGPWGNTPPQQSYRPSPNTLVLLDGGRGWSTNNGVLSPSEGWDEHPLHEQHPQEWGKSCDGWGTGHFTAGRCGPQKNKGMASLEGTFSSGRRIAVSSVIYPWNKLCQQGDPRVLPAWYGVIE